MNISPLSNSLSTIYLSAVNDTCNALIELSWTPYLNPAHPHENYDLWIGTGGVPAVLHETLSPSETSYNYTDIAPSTAYCFYLSASDNAGNVSTSNMQCITSGVETIPAWTTADAVSVENQELVVRGSYDRSTDINKFIVQLLNKATGKWVKAGTATGIDGAVIIAVDDADTSSINLYRIAAVNSCGKALAESPPVRNIVLTSSLTNTVIELKWNNPFTSHPARFTVWRDTGHGFSELPGNLSDTVITEDYTLFGEDVSVERIAYYVTAIAAEEPADALASISNISLIPAISNIFMPNAFTPDGDGLNDIFIPKLSFTPEDYEFRIYSRTGILLFRTGNDGTGWDGRYKGSMMPPGVYLWKLSYATQSGIREQRTGTVTILP
jgi:gliding motility-associated-like protein